MMLRIVSRKSCMTIDENTRKCISIAGKPGTFGVKFHNAGYQILGLNYCYVALKVPVNLLESTIQLVRDNFHGCSVSMPHKVQVIDYLDALDDSAQKVGAVNTILKLEDGSLKGYNTDYYGARMAIENNFGYIADEQVLLLGAGGVAKAIACAVQDLGGDLTITNRTQKNAVLLAQSVGANVINWEERDEYKGYLLINATSLGMESTDVLPISERALANFSSVMDVVVNSTRMMEVAKSLRKIMISGIEMTTYQASKQFEIYTGHKLPEDFIERMINR
jgi:shikimate dehydrogenase